MKSLKRSLVGDQATNNISSKVYIRSTRNGRVQKIVREQYLRKDIPCSSQLCSVCASTAATDSSGNGKTHGNTVEVQSLILIEKYPNLFCQDNQQLRKLSQTATTFYLIPMSSSLAWTCLSRLMRSSTS